MVQSGAGKAYQPAITKNNRFPSSVLKPATPQEPGPGQPNNKLRRPPYYEDQKVGKLTLELPPASSGGRYNPVTI
jgi:hypothetical protein